MKHKGMTLTELVVGMAVLMLLAGMFELNPNSYTQTARREAEKLSGWLSNLMLQSDRTQVAFKLTAETQRITALWQIPDPPEDYRQRDYEVYFDASAGCSFDFTAPNQQLIYSYVSNNFSEQGGHIKIYGRGAPHYVIISVGGARVRMSDTCP